jgi:hypothetical protein
MVPPIRLAFERGNGGKSGIKLAGSSTASALFVGAVVLTDVELTEPGETTDLEATSCATALASEVKTPRAQSPRTLDNSCPCTHFALDEFAFNLGFMLWQLQICDYFYPRAAAQDMP